MGDTRPFHSPKLKHATSAQLPHDQWSNCDKLIPDTACCLFCSLCVHDSDDFDLTCDLSVQHFHTFPRPLKDAGIIDYFWDLTKWIKHTPTRQLQFGKRRRHKHAVQCVNVTSLWSCAGVFNLLAFITYQRDKIPVMCCQKRSSC